MAKIYSPWSYEEVDNLNERQKINTMHPYTCLKCGDNLVAYFSGWRCSNPSCDYRQNWAHKDDVEGTTIRLSKEKLI